MSSDLSAPVPLSIPTPLWLRVAAIPVAAVVVLGGLWLLAGQLAPGYYGSIAFAVVWFVAVSIGIGLVARRAPGLRWPLRGTFVAIVLVVGGWSAWTTSRTRR